MRTDSNITGLERTNSLGGRCEIDIRNRENVHYKGDSITGTTIDDRHYCIGHSLIIETRVEQCLLDGQP